jgi:hypothetical protein
MLQGKQNRKALLLAANAKDTKEDVTLPEESLTVAGM